MEKTGLSCIRPQQGCADVIMKLSPVDDADRHPLIADRGGWRNVRHDWPTAEQGRCPAAFCLSVAEESMAMNRVSLYDFFDDTRTVTASGIPAAGDREANRRVCRSADGRDAIQSPCIAGAADRWKSANLPLFISIMACYNRSPDAPWPVE